MGEGTMIGKNVVALSAGVILLCVNMGMQNEGSVAGGGRPDINFYGTLKDNTGASYAVENITIGGMFKQIPVYAKPASPTANPGDNRTLLDLKEIKAIIVPEGEKELTFGGKPYTEIVVVSLDGTKRTYMIETSKLLRCGEKNASGDTEKELAFRAVMEINIRGYSDNANGKNSSSEKNNDTKECAAPVTQKTAGAVAAGGHAATKKADFHTAALG